MNLEELINKTDHTQSEKIFLVESYIYKRKSAKVEINLGKPSMFGMQVQLELLDHAYTIALNWYKDELKD